MTNKEQLASFTVFDHQGDRDSLHLRTCVHHLPGFHLLGGKGEASTQAV